mmetsp:Transcript_1018/g.3575  ORF Transcript_1018/g.3575 Transcript_1018/m.3575 type:complete len:779 (+) Transcript_1018:84-2420(+)|eukprot:scaffold3551_cov408-Prasinococcus_capsulatus_cf.AAC.10
MGAIDAETLALFVSIGLEEGVAKNALANAKVSANLVECVKEAGVEGGCEKAVGNLVYSVATKFPANALVHRPSLLKLIVEKQVKNIPQCDAAYAFLKKVGSDTIAPGALEEACGAGVEVSVEQVKEAVRIVIAKNESDILEQRYRFVIGKLIPGIKAIQPWAEGSKVKQEIDEQILALLGPKTAEDDKPLPPKKKEKKKPPVDAKEEEPVKMEIDHFSIFPKPETNNYTHTEVHFSTGEVMRIANTKAQLEEHLHKTGGRVLTRFPPEPNGYLHIGHAKAMNVDFGYAKDSGGDCYLRYDDTNPAAEKTEYIEHIQEIVAWLGWKPFRITYSSDYFQELYELAVKLIKVGKAYVCHQTGEEIKKYREERKDSPWRNRPIEESLQWFEDMRRGLVPEGKATLRMKQDMRNENYNMFDLIAYRIKFEPHPHAGDKWCIYPSYDYTHCIVDSLEQITHSLCTLEFETRRASYFWLLEVLDLYKPHVWEYGRLNITNNVLSKRKLHRLVHENHVDGWDDPRLLTLAGLRRRGASPAAINAFCRDVGITRNHTLIPMVRLEHYIRNDMNANANRLLAVLEPLKVVIVNMPEDHIEELNATYVLGDKSKDYKVPLTRVLYIEQSDFRMKDAKDYYGLAPGKSAILRYAYPVTVKEALLDECGNVKEVHVEYDKEKSIKPKGVLHWVAEPRPGHKPLTFKARLYSKLFKSDNPAEVDNYLDDLNPESKVEIQDAMAVPKLAEAKAGDCFQFERVGYFCVDPLTAPGNIVVNRTVTLKESSAKSKA